MSTAFTLTPILTGSSGVVVVSHSGIKGVVLVKYCDIASRIIRMPASPCASAADTLSSSAKSDSAEAVGRGRSNDNAYRPRGALVVPRSRETMA